MSGTAPARPAAAEDLDLPGGPLTLYRQVWAPAQADDLLARLRAGLDWEQHWLSLFGRRVAAPRLSAWYADPGVDYGYSGLRLQPRAWPALLTAVRSRVEALCGARFNSVLANLYRDGRDSMGWHSDDEPELGAAPLIASVSFGAERTLRLRRRDGAAAVPGAASAGVTLPHGSLLVMGEGFQACWQHSLAKTRRPCGPRVNLTFRYDDGAPGGRAVARDPISRAASRPGPRPQPQQVEALAWINRPGWSPATTALGDGMTR